MRLKTEVPIRDCSLKVDLPGHCEVDCVAHCGGSLSGKFAWTVTFTDILTGWTECESIWNKSGVSVSRALKEIESRLPFKITNHYFDNGCEFMNEDVIDKYARDPGRAEKIIVHRGRPYKKNDQCYVEQKNYTHVRTYFGYGRIDWEKAISMMNNVYRGHWRAIQNFYFPQQRLEAKQRFGSRIVRRMSNPQTPFQRLRPFIEANKIESLEAEMAKSNPFQSMKSVRSAIRNIFGYFKNSMERSEWGKVVK
jgi:hypothetical protein